ncbi:MULTISPECIES: beta-ketoacyl-ACP synthase II [Acidobacterium]|uniref:3-oxoacyl-[acyl-carrier-protein] synthase 2 n=1 Tax=Acidobacterium capsulatum (strain ATCC 51196 / DSM 11244 / BCRC 80197 / JCM 7670 / NBRC 15755 / NCIMB 13165 / 161) TaxID=240015 RepID=C1F7P4_ACIC5|nr:MULTISPECIES: beta-ketoacyl-ACP synthase II [Acidobacterium]ACO31695.1 3-oxoacyl-(acyl-carrier-protein) synthase II [Acidobacterium capsulatum ATCC 51196]HCT59663.1 beta-ketoacyl-[acyl-carrier-protein] synthase II [Acidobacterium sp.]
MQRKRVVVTGLGLICGVGNTAPEVWKNLVAGKSGMAPITGFDATGYPVTFAAEVKGFDALSFIDKKEARKMARFIHLAIAACDEAVASAGLKIEPSNAERIGVFIGSGIGGFEIIEREHTNLMNGGPRKISPFFIPGAIINMAAGQVSIRLGAKGPISATATACSTSANSIGDAYRVVERGDADIMIAGGSEAAVTPMSVGGFAALRALSTRNDEPTRASRPFDKDRDGFVVGEGAGILILEELEHAKARGANILAEICGYGMSADAYHMTGIAPEGEGAQRSMRAALKDAGMQPSEIDYVNAHATSTPLGDGNESRALELVFGEHALSHKLKVSSTKSMTGHLLGGAGGLEAGITVQALLHQMMPPTINLDNVDEGCRLDYLANRAQSGKIDAALSNSFGFGGINASLVFKRWH